MGEFIPGIKLNELFYHEAVKPILQTHFPELVYSAALIGYGSDVLGYDTPQSTDHMWGPRLYLFVKEADLAHYKPAITLTLSQKLPLSFYGYPTNYSKADAEGIRVLEPVENGPVNHLVWVETLEHFFSDYIGLNILEEVSIRDWLVIPQQKLLAANAGQVYYDGLGRLEAIRQQLNYYPHDLWLWLLSAQWDRIAQEEAFVGRCGDAGDELGSSLVAHRIVQNIMRLAFLMEQRYAPYSKWFGTAFSRLNCAPTLTPLLQQVLRAENWKEREQKLSFVYTAIASLHNALNITQPLETEVSFFHNRPYQVIHAGRFVEEIKKVIRDETVKTLAPLIGGIDQFTDSTLILGNPKVATRTKNLFW